MKRTPLRPMSNKRRTQMAERSKVVAAVHERDGGCVALATVWGERGITYWTPGDLDHFPARCAGPLDAHEIVQRSVRPGAWLEPDLIVSLCRAHHDFVSNYPAEAMRIGLLANSWDAANFEAGRRVR